MASPFLHIVAFNIPYPPDYGGVIDIYYKVKSLSAAGIRIILHCFEYGRKHSKELEDLCFKVYYYPRKSGLKYHVSSDPFIVSTRNAKSMPEHLLGDSFPVLFEGLHTTGMLAPCAQARKTTMVRAHNIEHQYYRALSRSERNPWAKLFLRTEARRLQKYETVLQQADYILGIAKHETAYFEASYGNALFVPPFHRYEEPCSRKGSGDIILFHGHLGISENSETFLSLARHTLGRLPFDIVVAGKDPSSRFQKKLSNYENIRLVANPGDFELEELIAEAHINLLFTSQSTGIKLKLLHALFAGRHCVVNPAMVEGTGLGKLCHVADSPEALLAHVHKLMRQPFTPDEIQERKMALKRYSNRASAEIILRILA